MEKSENYRNAYIEGHSAFGAWDSSVATNPYAEGESWEAWEHGWHDADMEDREYRTEVELDCIADLGD